MTNENQTMPNKLTSKLTSIFRHKRMNDEIALRTLSGTEAPSVLRDITESWNSPDSTGISALPAETGLRDDVVRCAPEYPESSSRECDPFRLEQGPNYHAIKNEYHEERLENEVDDSASRRMLQRPQNGTSPPPPDNGVEAHELDDFGPRAPAPAPAEVPEPPEEESDNGSDRWSASDICCLAIFTFFFFIAFLCFSAISVCLFIPECYI
uniref:Uncharacterized protein n=1 Tax=Panagrellus redivivus TaxID=6233 RepID=A0A7E4VZU2_PANRE